MERQSKCFALKKNASAAEKNAFARRKMFCSEEKCFRSEEKWFCSEEKCFRSKKNGFAPKKNASLLQQMILLWKTTVLNRLRNGDLSAGNTMLTAMTASLN